MDNDFNVDLNRKIKDLCVEEFMQCITLAIKTALGEFKQEKNASV